MHCCTSTPATWTTAGWPASFESKSYHSHGRSDGSPRHGIRCSWPQSSAGMRRCCTRRRSGLGSRTCVRGERAGIRCGWVHPPRAAESMAEETTPVLVLRNLRTRPAAAALEAAPFPMAVSLRPGLGVGRTARRLDEASPPSHCSTSARGFRRPERRTAATACRTEGTHSSELQVRRRAARLRSGHFHT